MGRGENQFEDAERLLERKLTPEERRWLTLADELSSEIEKHSELHKVRPDVA